MCQGHEVTCQRAIALSNHTLPTIRAGFDEAEHTSRYVFSRYQQSQHGGQPHTITEWELLVCLTM